MSEEVMVALVLVTLIGCVTFILNSTLQTWGRVKRERNIMEMQTKLLDRLGSGVDVMSYVNSDAYRQLMEGGGGGRNVYASRVLNSIQAGVVMLFGGGGMFLAALFVSVPEGASFLRVVGGILLALGVGMTLSAGWTYALLKKWGLLGPKGEAGSTEAA